MTYYAMVVITHIGRRGRLAPRFKAECRSLRRECRRLERQYRLRALPKTVGYESTPGVVGIKRIAHQERAVLA